MDFANSIETSSFDFLSVKETVNLWVGTAKQGVFRNGGLLLF